MLLSLCCLIKATGWANIPGGGTGTGPNVVLTDNGSTVTLANGLVSIVITKTSAEIHTINYTYNNGGTVVTNALLSGGNGGGGGYLYWFQNGGTFIAGPFTESVVANNGDYAEISLAYASATNGVMDIHFSLLRGSPGFYTTAILTHRSQDGIIHIELRPNIYAGAQFNWMSVDAARNRVMQVAGGASSAVQGAPKECTLWTSGIYAGQYEDKYKYSADLAGLSAWGWSSVGAGGKNVGLWNITASPEYYPGGPLERSLMEHIGTTILNVFTGGYYGLGTDDTFSDGELWSKVYGPYFYYCNNITNTITSANQAALALYNDALAQGAAEQSAWPYSWFTNANYAPATNRGTVVGKIAINDSGNPQASAGNLWVGVAQQPTIDTSHDFQEWAKPYQFWTKTDTNGYFTISDVIAGANYTLFAFGPGAAGTFLSQNLTGGDPPLLCDIPASPFSITVMGGATNNLGTNTWTPSRVGATVFELGYPDRTSQKFRHGDDYWVGDIGPSSNAPSPIWSKWLEYPFDFPNGVNYLVGQSRWSTDWNFIQPVVTDRQGNYNDSSSTITFNLATAPTNGALASLYLGLTSDYYSAVVISINGNLLVNVDSHGNNLNNGVIGTPNNIIPTTGYYVSYGGSDTSIREGNNGAFTDERITFPASQLHIGINTISISTRQIGGSYFANHFMYDYLRLEMSGYVPPPPANVVAFAGNNGNLVCWPVTPGATSYNILRSTTAAGGYVSITNGVVAPVCGSGPNNGTYLDSTAANGTTNYYVVCSVNPTGSSSNSPPSFGVIPSAGISPSAPAAPTGLVLGSSSHQSLTLNWNASAGAKYYSIWRSTLVNTGGGSSNTLSTIILNNTTTTTSYTDTTPTDGSIYRYSITATSAGGTSSNSISVVGVAMPTAPASKPLSLTATYYQSTNVVLSWTAVPGAIGYIIKRAANVGGPFTFLQSITETVYYDLGLSANSTYYYQVFAVNAGGISTTSTNSANGLQPAPASLSALGDDTQILLSWPAASGATTYTLKRGTSSGNEITTVISGYTGLTFTNTGLVNETTYYYIVTASGAGGASGTSVEASATASAASNGTWTVDADGNWNTAANWRGGVIAFGPGNTADFSTISLTTNHTVTLDSERTISVLTFGDASANFNWTLAGTNKLTLGANPNINVVNQSATLNTIIAGSSGLTKSGQGTLILGSVAETFTNGLAVKAGNLSLDFSATNSPATNIVPAANALTLAGGTLQIIGANGGSSQTFASTAIASATSGQSIIAAAPVAGTNPIVTLGTLTGSAGGLVRFDGAAYNSGASSGTTLGSNMVPATATYNVTANTVNGGLIAYSTSGNAAGAYATVGLYDWATVSGGAIGPAQAGIIVGGSQLNSFYTVINGSLPASSFGVNIDMTASGAMNNNGTGGTGASYSTIRINTAGAITLNSGKVTAASIGGLLITPNVGANNTTFVNGSSGGFFASRAAGAATGLTVWQNNTLGEFIISAVFKDGVNSGVNSSYSQGGPGTVLLNGVNTYAGASYLDGGVTVIGANSSLGAVATGAAVNLNGGTLLGNASFALDNSGANNRAVNLNGAGGTLAASAGNTLTVSGMVAGSANLNIGTATIAGTGAGTANITPVIGSGTVSLIGFNTFTGDVNINAGNLTAVLSNNASNPVGSALGNPQVTRNLKVNSGGTLTFGSGDTLGGADTVVVATLVIASNGIVNNAGNSFNTLGPVTLSGGTLTGTGGATAAYQMYNLRGPVAVVGTTASTISGSGANSGYHLAAPTIFNVADVNAGADLIVSGVLVDQDATHGGAGSLIKTGAGTMMLSGTNIYTGTTTFNAGILNVGAPETPGISGPLGKAGTITFGGGTLQYSATNQYDYSSRFSSAANQLFSIDTAGQNVTFTNPLISSGGTLTKLGSGMLTLTGSNAYSGGTFVSSGILAVNNTNGSGTGSGNVIVQSGGALTGTGSLSGSVIVAAGGRLAPGNSFGALTISNNLTFASGSTAYFQVQRSPLTNSALKVSGSLMQDGTLTVTNSGAAAFIAGDSFKLFTASGYSGSFSSFNLPPLNSGLFWSTSRVAVDGTLGVVSPNPLVIRRAAWSGGNLVLQGTNGTPNWVYTVLSSTDVTLPLAQWTVTATNFFDAGGNFSWTNTGGANGPSQFYVIKVQ